MIAGGPRYRIWFTNLIYRNNLYTVTYKWPNSGSQRGSTCLHSVTQSPVSISVAPTPPSSCACPAAVHT
jgi:hypothetical protein